MRNLRLLAMFLAILFWVLSFAEMSWAATYYVAPNGNDSNPGTIDRPFVTINKGASILAAGDTLYIRGGTYNQTVYVGNSGTVSAYITIAGYPGETAIIDGMDTIPAGDWGELFSVYGNYVEVKDLTVQNSKWMGFGLRGQYDRAIRVKAYKNMENGILVTSDYCLVENCEVWWNAKSNEYGTRTRGNWAGGLNVARHPYYTTVRGNKVWNNWGEGLSSFEAEHTTIEDNIIYDNWATNVYLSDTRYCLLQRNLIYRTPGNVCQSGSQIGIELSNEVQNPISSDNIIVNNMVVGCNKGLYWWYWHAGDGLINVLIANNTFVNSIEFANISISGSDYHSNTGVMNNIVVQEDSLPVIYYPGGSGITFSNNNWSKSPPSSAAGTGDVIADPRLAKTGSTGPGALTPDYFKLLSNSPAINKANVLSEVAEDFFKTPRGSTPDIGAHEYVGAGTTPPAAPKSLRIR